MIRLVQRRLIIPRGDTGTFSIPSIADKDTGDVAIFTIFDPLEHKKIFEKSMELSDEVLSLSLTHGDTVNLPVGQYVWDIKFYNNPVFADEHLVSGEEIDSYYAAFSLPQCEIKETGDNLLMADDAPTSTLRPDQINLIEAALVEVNNAKEDAANSASEASRKAEAIQAQIPTKVSELENDSGYLTEIPFEVDCRTAAQWAQATNYVAPAGAILVYTDNNNIKIGDGHAYAVDLPFVTASVRSEVLQALGLHELDTNAHVSTAEKAFWNNKINCELEGELLILNRE